MSFQRMELLTHLLFFIFCVTYCTAYFIDIEAHSEECFYDKVTSGTKMSLLFEVTEGGFLDIDVQVIYVFVLFECIYNCVRSLSLAYLLNLT